MNAEQNKQMLSTLQRKSLLLRIDSLRSTTEAGSGHPTSCLSAADLISVLFFHTLRLNDSNPFDSANDRFIMSKGHAIPVVYAAWKQRGVITDQELLTLRAVTSPLEGHPTPHFPYNEAATGSLGQGLAIGIGEALAAKKDRRDYRTYVMLGDGEIAEGSNWEAFELGAYYGLDNIAAIVDCNRWAQSGMGIHGHEVEKYARKIEAFGWDVKVIDGHKLEEIVAALDWAQAVKGKPAAIIAKTFKGYGLPAAQDKSGYHGKPFSREECEYLIERIKQKFSPESPYFDHLTVELPNVVKKIVKPVVQPIALNLSSDAVADQFSLGKKLSPRKAFGYALAALGKASNAVVALDADVKNSTYTEIFESAYAERFIQCFIAEQAMVGIATGLATRGIVPFAATFGAFFSRAYDQIRMAAIGRVPLRLVGTHCGVHIGQDGPSQMALEDLAMFSAVPHAQIFYPADAVSTYKLVESMANYHDGISYLRATRGDLPVLYKTDEQFPVGGCKVLRSSPSDQAVIVAAGITVHEALRAADQLDKQGIKVAVIDLYSVKPFDKKTVLNIARAARNQVITVEDHYIQGGIGATLAAALINDGVQLYQCAVTELSRSGKPDELLALAGIDADSIVKVVMRLR